MKNKIRVRDPTIGTKTIKANGYSLVQRNLLARKLDFGGHTFLATGRQGSGKTSYLIHNYRRQREFNEVNEKFFWRGMRKCQFPKIPEWEKDRIQLFKLDGLDLTFYEEDKKLPDDEFDVKPFENFQDLWGQADYGDFNVVYLPEPTDFMDLLTWLVDAPRKGWASIYLDEIEDVAPDTASGDMWTKVGEFSDAAKECRKTQTSMLGATQTISEFHWKPRRKISYFLMCPGSGSINETRVWQRSIDGLEDHELGDIDVGQAWLASRNSNFDKIGFHGYPNRRKIKVRIR